MKKIQLNVIIDNKIVDVITMTRVSVRPLFVGEQPKPLPAARYRIEEESDPIGCIYGYTLAYYRSLFTAPVKFIPLSKPYDTPHQ